MADEQDIATPDVQAPDQAPGGQQPQPAPDKVGQYYDYLKKAGADVAPTLDSFKKTLANDSAARQYYQYLRNHHYDAPPNYGSFARTLGISAPQQSPPASPPQDNQPTPTPAAAPAPPPEHQISHTPIHDIRHLNELANQPVRSTVYSAGEGIPGVSVDNPEDVARNKTYKDQYKKSISGLADTWGTDPMSTQRTIEDFPEVQDENLLKQYTSLYKSNPVNYQRIKDGTDIQAAILHSGQPDAASDAHVFNQLAAPAQSDTYEGLQHNIGMAQEILSKHELGQQYAEKLKNVYSPLINTLQPGLLSQYWGSEDKKLGLSDFQYAGLETEKLFQPGKYQQDLAILRDNRGLDQAGGGEPNPIPQGKKGYAYDRGVENVLFALENQGRQNTGQYISQRRAELGPQLDETVQGYKDALSFETQPAAQKAMLQEFQNHPLVQEAAKLDDGQQSIEYARSEDQRRFPLNYVDNASREVKDAMSHLNGVQGAAHTESAVVRGLVLGAGQQADNTMRFIKNTWINLLGSDEWKAENAASNIGHQAETESGSYEGSAFSSHQGATVIDPELQSGVQKIFDDHSLDYEAKVKKATDLIVGNPDQIKANPAAGQQNLTGKAMIYTASNTIGQILGIADQSLLMGGLLGDAAKAQQMASAFVPMYVSTQNSLYEQSLARGDEKPLLSSHLDAAVISLASLINPDMKIVKGMVGAETGVGKMLAGVDETTWNKVLTDNKPVLDRMLAGTKATAKQLGLAGLQYGLIVPTAQYLIHKNVLNEDPNLGDAIKDGLLQTGISMAAPALLHGFFGAKNAVDVNPMQKYSLVEAGLHPKENIELIDQMVEKGQVSPDRATQIKEIIKHTGHILENTPGVKTDGTPMNEQEISDATYQLLRKKVLEGQLKNAPGPLQPVIEQRINEIDRSVADLHTSEADKQKTELNELLNTNMEQIKASSPAMEGKTREAIKRNEPETVFQDIYDQASETKMVEGKEVSSRKEVEDIFGKDLVKKAFDLQKKKTAKPTTEGAGAQPAAASYTPNTNLSPEHSAIEAKFGKDLEENYAERKQQYLQKFGNVINTDNARELSPDYVANKNELSSAVHEPASAFVKKVYADLLKEKPGSNMVVFTSGGTGAGKTSGINSIEGLKKVSQGADITFDSNMNGFDSSVKKIDQALASGRNAHIIYVYRDPVDAFENGVIPRMRRSGRSVPIEEHVNTHKGSFETLPKLVEHYKDDPRVQFVPVDNSLGKEGSTVASLGDLQKKAYFGDDLKDELYESANQHLDAGRISPSEYNGLTVGRKRTEGGDRQNDAEGTVPLGSAAVRGQSERSPQSRQEQLTPDYLVSRHADTIKDEQDKISSDNQHPLSPKGKKDASDLATEVQQHMQETGIPVTKVVTTGLERSIETGKKVADKVGAKVVSDPALNTWKTGQFDNIDEKDWKRVQKFFVEHPDQTEYLPADKNDPLYGKKVDESFDAYAHRTIEAHAPYQHESAGTLLIDHSNNMMVMDAYRKNGGEWNEQARLDYLSADKPEPATLTNQSKQDAIQEPSAGGEVPRTGTTWENIPAGGEGMGSGQQGQAPSGEAGGEGKGQKPPGGAGGGKVTPGGEERHNEVGPSHDAMTDLALRLGLKEPERGEVLTPAEYAARGRIMIAAGADPEKVARGFKRTKNVNPDVISVARAHLENLVAAADKIGDTEGQDSPAYKAALEKVQQWQDDVMKPMGTRAGETFTALQGTKNLDTGSFTSVARNFYELHKRELTEKQARTIKELTSTVKEKDAKIAEITKKISKGHEDNQDAPQANRKATFTEKTKKAADNFRKLKGKEFTFKDANGNDVPIQKMGISWNDLVELGAKAIEKSGQIADGIAAILDKVSNADWYKGLSNEDKNRFGKELTDHYANVADKKTAARIKALEKQLADLQQGKVKTKGVEHFQTDREKELKEQIFEQKNKMGLIPPKATPPPKVQIPQRTLAEKMATKQGNMFSPEDARDIWQHVKENYLDKGTNLSDALRGTSADIGLSADQILHAIATPKGGRELTTELFKQQNERNKASDFARRYVETANQGPATKFFNSLPSRFFNLKTYGHGTVGNITHAATNIFRPSVWSAYFPNVLKSFSLAYGSTANYEKAVTLLENRPNFDAWNQAGLAIDPREAYDDYQVFGKKQTWLGQAGTRGFTGLKFMRYDLAEKWYNEASNTAKEDPNFRQEIARLANHATGHSEVQVGKAIKALTFAPGLEISRWQRMITDPATALNTVYKSMRGTATPAEQAAAKIVLSGAGERLAVYSAALAVNAGLLAALGSNQKLNLTDPSKADWLKFKLDGKTLDLTGGVLGPLRLLHTLGMGAYKSYFGDKKDLRTKPDEKDAETLWQQLRYKAAPLPGDVLELTTGQDAMGNTLPWSKVTPGKGRKQLTGAEFAEDIALPIPIAAGFNAYHSAMDQQGVPTSKTKAIWDGVVTGMVEGFTGAKYEPDYSLQQSSGRGSRP